jgi:hypothetical protein
VEGSYDSGNEPVGSIKCWKSIKWLHNLGPLGLCSVSERERMETLGKQQ